MDARVKPAHDESKAKAAGMIPSFIMIDPLHVMAALGAANPIDVAPLCHRGRDRRDNTPIKSGDGDDESGFVQSGITTDL
jgi:hypothetical protein